MEKYYVKIGSKDGPDWGEYKATSKKALKEIVLNQIENLYPLNASPEGAEAYRNRFRGQPIFARKAYIDKEYEELV